MSEMFGRVGELWIKGIYVEGTAWIKAWGSEGVGVLEECHKIWHGECGVRGNGWGGGSEPCSLVQVNQGDTRFRSRYKETTSSAAQFCCEPKTAPPSKLIPLKKNEKGTENSSLQQKVKWQGVSGWTPFRKWKKSHQPEPTASVHGAEVYSFSNWCW